MKKNNSNITNNNRKENDKPKNNSSSSSSILIVFLISLLVALYTFNKDLKLHFISLSNSTINTSSSSSSSSMSIKQSYDFTKLDAQEHIEIPEQWYYFGFGDFVGNQGIQSIVKEGGSGFLRIDSNPFTLTHPSVLDHVKWLALTKESVAVPENGSLTCSFKVRANTLGADRHPFGDAIRDAKNDPRLAMGVVNSLDFETMLVADFAMAGNSLYAIYERLPFAKGDYASFTYMIPIATDIDPAAFLDLAITWDHPTKTVRWIVGGKVVYQVDRIGYQISREYVAVDRGGVEELAFPRSISCGFGTFSLLDSAETCHIDSTSSSMSSSLGKRCHRSKQTDTSLVRLDQNKESSRPYVRARHSDDSNQQPFVDEQSLESSRLFNQGAIIDIQSIIITTNQQ
ncbi:hypothetical protein DFA_01469 [Cavenderia fasciculata]|uniref:Uncharacterized protein n=1 Tax=Cavenderia fasciculata TaxID=261658 RepID=F4PT07_CACFS|nr:uncharacterized protein DFA_01469 [Cavenderia fasciculata]EGG21583.1 hypothetical protein DFA_01469 [Cavenderia fasciculata]|eukprot:XP_004359433.1 hypothetical protein DFA_01469 [Cavenderia fasciculata]